MSFDPNVVSDDPQAARPIHGQTTTDADGKPAEVVMSNNDPLVLQQRAINILEAKLRQAQTSAQAARDEVRL